MKTAIFYHIGQMGIGAFIYQQQLHRLYASGLENIVSDIRHTHIKNGVGKYSFFNRDYMFTKKYKCDGDIYFFPEGIECERIIDNPQQYPFEKFFKENRNNL